MTVATFDAFLPRVLFLDDEQPFLDAVKEAGLRVATRLTTDLREVLELVAARAVDFIVSDMRMPAADGVHVLEEVHGLDPAVGLALLTGFEPTSDQLATLKRIGATVYYKFQDLPELLNSIQEQALAAYVDRRDTNALANDAVALKNRLTLLEDMHAAWIQDLTEQLESMPNLDAPVVYTENGPTSVRDLLEDIRGLQPRGVRYLRLWLRAKRTVREARR
jgi:DNA-binding NtrC family response regulator